MKENKSKTAFEWYDIIGKEVESALDEFSGIFMYDFAIALITRIVRTIIKVNKQLEENNKDE